MAAFPPPSLRLHLPDRLHRLFTCCERHCDRSCCGVDAFDPNPGFVGEWFVENRREVEAVLEQFESILGQIGSHRGSIVAGVDDGCFNHVWQTPHDCLTYFADWRRVIAEAVASLPNVPFFSPSWLTETVLALRDSILADRAFDRLPILADALEEAGCDTRAVLDHLRANDDHSHMCWVLDVLSTGGR